MITLSVTHGAQWTLHLSPCRSMGYYQLQLHSGAVLLQTVRLLALVWAPINVIYGGGLHCSGEALRACFVTLKTPQPWKWPCTHIGNMNPRILHGTLTPSSSSVPARLKITACMRTKQHLQPSLMEL